MASSSPLDVSCPTPSGAYERIVLGHGSGGRLSRDLLRDVFLEELGATQLDHEEDQSSFDVEAGRLAFTTDSFVVSPLFFPGGNIGDLAVNGTVNDLAVGGATPLRLSAAFILEEGLPVERLRTVVRSMRRASVEAGAAIVTGDTKVVERGKADGLFITTTGVGMVPAGRRLSAKNARPGDRVLVSGMLGDHGIAVLAKRDGIELETEVVSDTAPLSGLVEALLAAAPDARSMRDPTRGGLASALNEIAASSGVGIELDERLIPLRTQVRAVCELLGLDPLYVASEGRLVAIVPPESEAAAIEAMRAHPLGRDAVALGTVVDEHRGRLSLRTLVSGKRFVPMLAGEQLPRIC